MIKSELREKYNELRNGLSPNKLAVYSQNITELLLKNVQFEAKTVSLFLPIEKKGEINTYGLMEKILSIGGKVALPVSDFDNNEINHYLYQEGITQLVTNKYGIPEPVEGTFLAPVNFDVVIVPLLAVDIKGNRVGYGKGFYDRFLSMCREDCLFIGLHLFEPEKKTITDTDGFDIPLHAVVTPENFIRF